MYLPHGLMQVCHSRYILTGRRMTKTGSLIFCIVCLCMFYVYLYYIKGYCRSTIHIRRNLEECVPGEATEKRERYYIKVCETTEGKTCTERRVHKRKLRYERNIGNLLMLRQSRSSLRGPNQSLIHAQSRYRSQSSFHSLSYDHNSKNVDFFFQLMIKVFRNYYKKI